MFEKFKKLCALGDNIGIITSAHMYDHGFLTVEGHLHDGSAFSITLKIDKEENKNGN